MTLGFRIRSQEDKQIQSPIRGMTFIKYDHYMCNHGWVTSAQFHNHVRLRKKKQNFFDLYKFSIVDHNLSFIKRKIY